MLQSVPGFRNWLSLHLFNLLFNEDPGDYLLSTYSDVYLLPPNSFHGFHFSFAGFPELIFVPILLLLSLSRPDPDLGFSVLVVALAFVLVA
jgi:hypothetical protein